MTKEIESLLTEIEYLINKKSEGGYWDFKQEWYHDNFDLLHDIICMANNLENRDAYIIIGVTDDYNVCGIVNDSNRKNTQNLIDFLRNKKFAGGNRPTVEVISLVVHNCNIDVIQIKNSDKIPYYLEEKYGKVAPYHIYTRIQDSNTPLDKSADLCHIETLWQKRFHIFDEPKQKIHFFLKNKNAWIRNATDECTMYHYKFAPEYTIKIPFNYTDDTTAIETYTLSQLDKYASWHTISLYYHQPVLCSYSGILMDGGRYRTVEPNVGLLKLHSNDIIYYHLCEDSLRFTLYQFFLRDENPRHHLANSHFIAEVLFFKDDQERLTFETDFNYNIGYYEECLQYVIKNPSRHKITHMQAEYDKRIALKQFQQEYAKQYDGLAGIEPLPPLD